jgi:hypothetical protein
LIVAVTDAEPRVTVIVTGVCLATAEVGIENLAMVLPAETTTPWV